MTDAKSESLIKFPSEFVIKVMGEKDAKIEKIATNIIKKHCPNFDGQVDKRDSREGNYISLTFKIIAESKKQLDAIYTDLNKNKDILMAL